MSLLAACKRGEEAAWREFYTKYSGTVYRVAVLFGVKNHHAEDIAQKVFVVAHRKIADCNDEKALASWLVQITRRLCANHRRSVWIRDVFSQEDINEPAFEHETRSDVTRELAVRNALAKVSPKCAEALTLMFVEDFTHEEIAKILGIPIGTVASRIRLGRKQFMKYWEGSGDFEFNVPRTA